MILDWFRKEKKILNDIDEKIKDKSYLKEIKPPVETKTNKFTITFRNGKQLIWEQRKWEEREVTEGKIMPWLDFYHWFFGRENSKYYVMKYDKGQTMFRRDEIYFFNVEIVTKFI